MKRILILAVLFGLAFSWIAPVWSHNPFTSAPETQHKAPEPLFKSPIFVKIIVWQHQLKEKMAALIRGLRDGDGYASLFVLVGLAVLYGVIHAAGPGHGKVVATTYVLSQRATIASGIFFGCCFAMIHALSGVVGVLGLRYIIQRSVNETLASTTTITQIISFGLITLLGLVIFIKHGSALFSSSMPKEESHPEQGERKAAFAWAIAVGLVPCPAVVMVMLFCMSMDALLLGLVLAAGISIGMAATISSVVITVIMGKTLMLTAFSKNYLTRIEGILGLLSGAAISVFGAIFFLSAINSVPY